MTACLPDCLEPVQLGAVEPYESGIRTNMPSRIDSPTALRMFRRAKQPRVCDLVLLQGRKPQFPSDSVASSVRCDTSWQHALGPQSLLFPQRSSTSHR